MLLPFVAEHTSIVLDSRRDASAVAAFVAGCEMFVRAASVTGRDTHVRVLVGDCEGDPCNVRVKGSGIGEQLLQLQSLMRRKARATPLTARQLIAAASSGVAVPAGLGANHVLLCFAAKEAQGGAKCVVEQVAPSDLAAVALRCLAVGTARVAEVPLSTRQAVPLDFLVDLGRHALLCSPNPPLAMAWGRVSRACMSRAYRCAHLAREVSDSVGVAPLTDALKSLPAGVGLELEGTGAAATARRVAHYSERHGSLVLRCCGPETEPGPSDDLVACCNSPLPPELHRLYWGADSFVEATDLSWASRLLQALLLKREQIAAWPQLAAAPVSRATAWRALWRLLAARTVWCPALMPLSGFLPPDLRPLSASPVRLEVPAEAPALRGGALYAGLGLVSKPKFGGKDGE